MTKYRKFYTVKDIAHILQLRENTIYRYVESGKLKAYTFGNVLRISPTQFKQFCEYNRRLVNSKGGNDQ